MSIADRPDRLAAPFLCEGQKLDRAEFHERYKAMPPETRAELIGGIVYIGSPLGFAHGKRDGDAVDWLGYYRRFTVGVERPLNATTQFDDYGEPQPDSQLLIPGELGGRSRIVDGYIVGPPELVVEVAHTTRAKDLGPKRRDFERAGVPEYVFVGVEPDEIRWFILRGGRYEDLAPGDDGIYRSEVFPGLWLAPSAFLARDMERVYAVLDLGLATAEHAAFVAKLSAASLASDRK